MGAPTVDRRTKILIWMLAVIIALLLAFTSRERYSLVNEPQARHNRFQWAATSGAVGSTFITCW